jgi:hypothetical protein
MSSLPADPYDALTLMLGKGVMLTYNDEDYYLNNYTMRILYDEWRLIVIKRHGSYQQRLRDRKFVEWIGNYLRIASQDDFVASEAAFSLDKARYSATIRFLQPWIKEMKQDEERTDAWLKVVHPRIGRSKRKKKTVDPEREARMAEYAKLREELKRPNE